ncbi:MAG: hypothetical protein IKJ40_03120 [Bacteroidales bacterium]|nr:hypothetical protein [Bacteroidales bacterium]MBR3828278.1 hypothetical protein [Bacteroidales bacterium]
MNSQLIIRNIGRFILLMLLQVLIFNNIYLGGYINPCIYVLFIAMLPTTTGRIPAMLIAFFTGLCVDVSSNLLGFHAFACTALAYVKGLWLDEIIIHDNEEGIEMPCIYTCPLQQYSIYLFLILFVFNIIYHTLLIFSLRDILDILLSALLSTIVTWILAMLYQSLLLRKTKFKNKA